MGLMSWNESYPYRISIACKLSDEFFSRYGPLENYTASGTGMRIATGVSGVTTIALCTTCSRAKNETIIIFVYVTDVVFLINFDGHELTRLNFSVSRCTEVVLDFLLSGFKPKVGISLSFVIFRK